MKGKQGNIIQDPAKIAKRGTAYFIAQLNGSNVPEENKLENKSIRMVKP